MAMNGNWRRWRTVHLVTGFTVALWLLVMTVTGVLINHQEGLGLTEIEVPNAYLPAHYTDEFHPDTTRLNVVLADLHSGRFFGSKGRLLSDVIGLLVLISITSGVYSFRLRRRNGSRRAVESEPGPCNATENKEARVVAPRR